MKVGDLYPGAPPAVAALGVTLSVDEWAALSGWGRNPTYAAIERGEFPAPVLRTGRRIRIPAIPALTWLGLLPTKNHLGRGEENDVS